MKKETAFFKDKRAKPTAENIIALYRALGLTDAQIKEDMNKIKAQREGKEADDENSN